MNFGFTIATGTFETVTHPAFITAALAAALMLAFCFRRHYRSATSMLWRHGLATIASLALLFVTICDGYSATKASFNFYVTRPSIELRLNPKKAAEMADKTAAKTADLALAENSCVGHLADRATIPASSASDWSSRWSALTDLC